MNWLAKWTIKRQVNNIVSASPFQSSDPEPTVSEQLSDLAHQVKDKCQEAYESTTNWFKRVTGLGKPQCASHGCQRQTFPSSDYCLTHKCRIPGCNQERHNTDKGRCFQHSIYTGCIEYKGLV